MNDDQDITAVRTALRALYPAPHHVDHDVAAIIASPTPTRRRTLGLVTSCVLTVAALALAVSYAAPTPNNSNQANLSAGSQHASSTPALMAPTPQPILVGDRLTRSFSIDGGRIQLTPVPSSYEPRISRERAAQLLGSDSGPVGGGELPKGVTQPPLFLAMLTNYAGPFDAPVTDSVNAHTGPEPVWVSLVYVTQYLYGGPGMNDRPTLPLGDQITTISAETGKFTSGVNITAPDPTAITTPPTR